MAYNVGFAQVTVSPVFTGMQRAIDKQVKKTFPAAGKQAGRQMANGFTTEVPRQRGAFTRAFSGVGNAASSALGAAGATSAARFTSSVTSGISRGMRAVTSSVGAIGTGIASRMAAAGRTAGTGFSSGFMASLGPVAAIFGAGGILTSGFSRLSGIENAESKLIGLGHTAESVQQIMDNALDSVRGTPYALQDAVSAAAGLVAAGIEPGEALEQQLKNIADAATIAGIPLNDMGAIWNKVAASGRIQGEELAQLGDRGIPILQLLSKHLGVSVDEVRKLASEGKVSFDDFAAAMNAGMGGAALEAANTTTGAFANLKAALGRMGAEILNALGFDSWKDAILSVTESVDGITGWIKENSSVISSFAAGIGLVTAAFGALRVAIGALTRINPIVAALSLLAGLFIHLWRTNEDFRNGVTAAWNAIREVISRVWEGVKPVLEAFWSWVKETLAPALTDFWNNTVKPVFQSIGAWIKQTWEKTILPALKALWSWIQETLVPVLQNFWNKVVKPVWEAISAAIKFAWEKVIQPAFRAIKAYIDNVLIPVFRFLYNNVIKPVWSGISFAIEVAWNAIRLVFDAIKWAIERTLAPIFRWLKDNVITPVWNGIRDAISRVWNNNIKPIFEALGNFIENTVAPGFQSGVDRIRDIWDSLKAIAAAPINFVIETVYNGGIKRVFDSVAEAIGSSARLPRATPIRARARGGFTPTGWTLVGEEGPELVNFTAPGRVYTAAETQRMLGASGENEVQKSFSPSNPPHGGPLDWISDRWNDVKRGAQWLADGVRDATGKVFKWVRGGLAKAAEIVLNPIKGFISNQVSGRGMLGDLIGGAATNAINSLVEWIKGEDEKGPADPGGRSLRGALPHVNAAAWEVADAINPRMRMQAFNQSMHWTHRAGRAIDFIDNAANLRRVRDYLVANATRLAVTEVIYNWRRWTPSRGWHPLRGGYGNDPGHTWHVHSTHKATPTYDSGGWLTPGVKTVANFTGKPEAVLTDRQWATYHRLAEEVATRGVGDIYHVAVEIDPKDLAGLRSVEEFTTMLRRKTRQRNGG